MKGKLFSYLESRQKQPKIFDLLHKHNLYFQHVQVENHFVFYFFWHLWGEKVMRKSCWQNAMRTGNWKQTFFFGLTATSAFACIFLIT